MSLEKSTDIVVKADIWTYMRPVKSHRLNQFALSVPESQSSMGLEITIAVKPVSGRNVVDSWSGSALCSKVVERLHGEADAVSE